MSSSQLPGLLLACAITSAAHAQTVYDVGFVNGLALSGGALDRSAGSDVERRLGYFSDLYYDRQRNEWWGLSDRGPGGGTLSYETRVQRFTLDVAANGAIGNFQVAQTIKFTRSGVPLNGLAPNPSDVLGNAFDPEGFVINPKNGNLLVSDEYGPSLYEFDRNGQLVREYTMAPNLVPKVGATPNYDAKPPTLTSGREPNRGLEGLAISPDGKYAYAVLQNGAVQDGWSSSSRGRYTRIVKFDTATGQAVGQYAYQLDSASQGRGISALVALGNDRFMILERNNRGIGVGATLASPDKNVFMIDLNGATDVSGIDLPASGDLPFGFTAMSNFTNVIYLDVDTLAALGSKSPEKWEGLAVGPQLANGSFLVLAGSDNDYSVTQSDGGEQFDVWFRMSDADPFATSIQCPIGAVVGCTGALTDDYVLLPGVLHAYTANIDGYVAAVPEPETLALMLAGLIAVGGVAHRNRRTT